MLFLESGKIISPFKPFLYYYPPPTKALPDHNFTERKSMKHDHLLKVQFLMTGRSKMQHSFSYSAGKVVYQPCDTLEKTDIYTRTGVLQNIF